MIVTCPACQTRYRHQREPSGKRLNARCSRCNEVFPLEAAAPAYRVTTAAAPAAAGVAAASTAAPGPILGGHPAVADPGPASTLAEAAPPPPAVPKDLDMDVDMPAVHGDTGPGPEPPTPAAPSASHDAKSSEPPGHEPAEARALPRLQDRPRPTPVAAPTTSVSRSLFNIVFALVWVGLGAAGGYFGYPGEEVETLVASAAGGLAGLLAAGLMLRWISGKR